MRIQRESPGEAYTGALGAGLASILRGGDIVSLVGGLGAGKTTLTRSIARGLGVPTSAVSSPTFTLIHQYDVPRRDDPPRRAGGPEANVGSGVIRRIAHIDAYRLGGDDELDPLGWDRYFGVDGRPQDDVLAIIEWPERLGSRVPVGASGSVTISIEPTGESSRAIVIDLPESWADGASGGRVGVDRFIEREPARCRITRVWIPPTHPTYPFVDERARDADLHRWFAGEYKISRGIKPEDLEAELE